MLVCFILVRRRLISTISGMLKILVLLMTIMVLIVSATANGKVIEPRLLGRKLASAGISLSLLTYINQIIINSYYYISCYNY